MQYTKVQVAHTNTLPFRRAPASARGVWVMACAYCAQHENGGIITGGGLWSPEDWALLMSATPADIESAFAAGLLRKEGENVHVIGYDREGEEAYLGKSLTGQGQRVDKPAARALLERLLLPSDDRSIREWGGLCRRAGCVTKEEGHAFVEHAVESERKAGRNPRYARDVLTYAQTWKEWSGPKWRREHQESNA